jgi:hypothetical protein
MLMVFFYFVKIEFISHQHSPMRFKTFCFCYEEAFSFKDRIFIGFIVYPLWTKIIENYLLKSAGNRELGIFLLKTWLFFLL